MGNDGKEYYEVQKDDEICTLDKNASLNMEITLATGRGYVSSS